MAQHGLNWAEGVDTDGTLAGNSDAKLATQKAVKTYVDANAGTSTWGDLTGTLSDQTDLQSALDAKLDDSQLDTDTTLAADSDAKLASQKAVKAYVDAAVSSTGGTPVQNEVPSGTSNAVNQTFTLAHTPLSGTLELTLNGVRQRPDIDYVDSDATIIYTVAPRSYDLILAEYRY